MIVRLYENSRIPEIPKDPANPIPGTATNPRDTTATPPTETETERVGGGQGNNNAPPRTRTPKPNPNRQPSWVERPEEEKEKHCPNPGNALDELEEKSYIKFRVDLELKSFELGKYGVKEQKVGETFITNDGPNPAVPQKEGYRYKYHTYKLNSNENAANRRWYVIPETSLGAALFHDFPRIDIQGREAYDLKSEGEEAQWIIIDKNVYIIVCEEYNSDGEVIGLTQYRQVVLNEEENERLEQLQNHIEQVDANVGKIKEGEEIPIKAIHFGEQEEETEETKATPLSLYIGRDSENDGFKLLDLTPGASKMEYGGKDAKDAIKNFWLNNEYPPCLIQWEIEENNLRAVGLETSEARGTMQTNGSSVLGLLSGQLSWTALTLAGLGIVATLNPVTRRYAPRLFSLATAADVAASGLSIVNELGRTEPSTANITIDVLGIVTGLLDGALAIRAINQGDNFRIVGLNKFLTITPLVLDGGAAVLITVDAANQIETILNSNLSRNDKIGQIVRVIVSLSVTGGFLALGAVGARRDLDGGSPNSSSSGTVTDNQGNTPATEANTGVSVETDAQPGSTANQDLTANQGDLNSQTGDAGVVESPQPGSTANQGNTSEAGDTIVGNQSEESSNSGTASSGNTSEAGTVVPEDIVGGTQENTTTTDNPGNTANTTVKPEGNVGKVPESQEGLVDNQTITSFSQEYPNETFEVGSDRKFVEINGVLELTPTELNSLRNEGTLGGLIEAVKNNDRGFFRDKIDVATNRERLSDVELRAYMDHFDNDWKTILKQVYINNGNEKLMLQLTKFRKKTFDRMYGQAVNLINARNRPSAQEFDPVAAGSEQPTSDYDVTFSGVKSVEVEAVIEFNRQFRNEFGKESGTVFDTNVYTTGHMPSSAMGNRLKEVIALRKLEEYLKLPRDLAEKRLELAEMPEQGSPRYRELAKKIKEMEEILPVREEKTRAKVKEINDLRPENSEAQLAIDQKLPEDINQLDAAQINRQVEDVRDRLVEEVEAERVKNRVSPETQKQILADQEVMALLKQRRNMSVEEWLKYKNQLSESVNPDLRDVTEARLNKVDETYGKAIDKLNETITELNRTRKAGEIQVRDSNNTPETNPAKIKAANEDAELEAYNRLYEKYLVEGQEIRERLEELRETRSNSDVVPEELSAEIDQLTLQLNELQSKALFFSNEAYHTGPAAEHVVLGQQLQLGVPLEVDGYLISINEQLGFAMEQATEGKTLGKALWKSSKYMDRVNNALEKIKEKYSDSYDPVFDSDTQTEIKKMKDLFDKLILIKKEKGEYFGMSEKQKGDAAEQEAKDQGFNFGGIEQLRKRFVDFNVKINSQLRNARQGQYDTSPSELDTWLRYEPMPETSQTPEPENLAQKPRNIIELPEFG